MCIEFLSLVKTTMVAQRYPYGFFSGLCLVLLFIGRTSKKSRISIEQIISSKSQLRSTTDVFAVNPSTVRTNDENRTLPVSLSSANSSSDLYPLCYRDEIREGSWEPTILDAPPYLPRTVHLQCYPENEYKDKHWTHTYKWQPTASSSADCIFSDWNREDFCRVMRRATLLVSIRCSHRFSFAHL